MEYAKILQDHPLLVRIFKLTLPFVVVVTQILLLSFFLDQTSFLIVIGLMACLLYTSDAADE